MTGGSIVWNWFKFTLEVAGLLVRSWHPSLWSSLCLHFHPPPPDSFHCRRSQPLIRYRWLFLEIKSNLIFFGKQIKSYLRWFPNRIWVFQPHPTTLKWNFNDWEATNDNTEQRSNTNVLIINILTFGWWVGGTVTVAPGRRWKWSVRSRNASSPSNQPTRWGQQWNILPRMNPCRHIWPEKKQQLERECFRSSNPSQVTFAKENCLFIPCSRAQWPTSCVSCSLTSCNKIK